jgi:hemerythrin superfamily protein
MPSVIKLIEQDHREVEELFSQFEQGGDKNIAMKICTELDAHAEAEEKAFYPIVREEVDASLVKEAEEEHGEARQLIGRIKQTSDLSISASSWRSSRRTSSTTCRRKSPRCCPRLGRASANPG